MSYLNNKIVIQKKNVIINYWLSRNLAAFGGKNKKKNNLVFVCEIVEIFEIDIKINYRKIVIGLCFVGNVEWKIE